MSRKGLKRDDLRVYCGHNRDGYKSVEELEGKHGGFTVYSER